MPAGKLILVSRKPMTKKSLANPPVITAYKSRSKPSYGKPKVGKQLATAIKAVTDSKKETKYVGEALQAAVVGQAAATPAAFYRLIPNLTQGVQENQRVGDRIQTLRLKNTFTFNFSSTLQNNQDIVVNLWIVTVKGASSAGTVAGVLPGNFLKVGNGGNADPNDPNQPNMLQIVNHYPLNTDQYTYKRHYRFRMRRGIGQATNQNTGGEVAPTGVGPYESYKVITWSCKPPSFKFNGAGDQTPSNFYPVALVYATNADGSAYGDNIQMSVRRELYFKDA